MEEDPQLATIIAFTFFVLFFVTIPIASVLIAAFSKSIVIFLETCFLSAAGFLLTWHLDPSTILVGVGLQLGGLLLAIAGLQLRGWLVVLWHSVVAAVIRPSASKKASALAQPACPNRCHRPFSGDREFLGGRRRQEFI
jgi:hypothetical protein